MGLDISLYFDVDTGCEEDCRYSVFDANITHNLGKMADAAGVYQCLWRDNEDPSLTCAGDLIEKLQAGIEQMKADPATYKALNSPNGWGLYEDFLPWLEKLLEACIKYPKAKIHVSR